MKYMLLMNVPSGGSYQSDTWSGEDWARHLDFQRAFLKQLNESGELVAVEALTAPERAKLVRAGEDGLPDTDGVFPEAKEFLAGYWIIAVRSAERAYEIAAAASAAPGPGGAPLNLPIEVREVLPPPPGAAAASH